MENIKTNSPELEEDRELATSISQEESKEILIENVRAYLTLPERACIENEDGELAKELGTFLVEEGYIKKIGMRKNNWAFEYNSESKTIFISEHEMPQNEWRDFIFRKQTQLENGKSHSLFPMHPIYSQESNKDEIPVYRFLHEISHTYQEYLKNKESAKYNIEPERYYENSVAGNISTPFSTLFKFCYKKRKEEAEKENNKKYSIPRGFSIWGNIENYSHETNEEIKDKNAEYTIRALEDANEFVTMCLWNPKYFATYTDYLFSNSKVNLYRRGIIKIKEEEAEFIKELVHILVEDMKKDINYH